MSASIENQKHAVAICLILLLMSPLSAWAALSISDDANLERIERVIFGKPRTQLSQESRLRALEINLFGKTKSGSQQSRLAAISSAMSSPSSANYLPPLAGSLDTAGSSSEPVKTAPRVEFSDSYVASAPEEADRAKESLRQALQLHNSGDMAGAERLFKQALSLDPRSADANFNLGTVLEDKGDLNGALRYYQAAARLTPGDKDIADAISGVRDKINQEQIAQKTQRDAAKKLQLKKIADKAAAAYKSGDYAQAISSLNEVAAQSPDDANVQFGLAQAWRGKGDLNKARQYLSRALAIAPGNRLYQSTLNDLNLDIQKTARANSNANQPTAGDSYEPPAAPDFRNAHRNGPADGVRNFDNSDIASASGDFFNSGDGGVQPFTNQGEGVLYGQEIANGVGRSGFGSGNFGMGLGSLSNLGGGVRYGGFGNRLVRGAMGGALSGAAIGALTNMRGPGGFRSGAMKGAIYGGLFGLMSGF